jgi:Mimiviridae putative poly(A) polymerase catalytic subunit
MALYTNSDIDLVLQSQDKIQEKLKKIKSELSEPSFDELKKAHELVKDYCIQKKKKLYGGYALHLLLVHKNPDGGIYDEEKIPDIDIYTYEPLDDMYNICNILHKKGMKYIMGQEALHKETYTIKFYNETLCDLSYVPKNIYHRMPFIEVRGLHCIHPNFMTIDYLRMMSNPLDSYWRFFGCEENLKAFRRFIELQKVYKLPYNDRDLQMDKPKKELSPILNVIYKFLFNRKTIVTIGFYAYNYFCRKTGYSPVNIPYYEFISTDYRQDALELIDILKKENENIMHEEFNPFFQYTDYNVEIYVGDTMICRIYNHNKRCVPYQDVPAFDFLNNKSNDNDSIRIGSFTVTILHLLIDAQKARVNNNNQLEKFYYHMLSHCIQMRDYYFKTKNKNMMDDTIFEDFIINCIGEEMTMEKEKRLRIEKRKRQKKPLVHRYTPADNFVEKPPKFIFNNSSGNKVNNPKNLRLADDVKDEDDIDETSDTDTSDTDSQKGGNEYEFNVNQPYFDQIKNGEKTYEGRLKKKKITELKTGDMVVWKNNNKTVKTRIKNIYEFNTFFDGIKKLGLDKTLPSEAKNNKSINNAIDDVYRQWYSEEDEKELGVIFIELDVMQ